MTPSDSQAFRLDDASAVVLVGDIDYHVHRSLIARLSPKFFKECVTPITTDGDGAHQVPSFQLKSDLGVTKEEFDALIAHLYHDISLDEDEDKSAPFKHVLRLYLVTAPTGCGFKSIHRVAARGLRRILRDEPLRVDFDDWSLLQRALDVGSAGDEDLKAALRKALLYAYTVDPSVSFGGDDDDDEPRVGDEETHPSSSTPTLPPTLSPSTATLCTHLTSTLATHFAPTLFQPPAARHMRCTDVYAALWMSRAVQPAFEDRWEGTGNPLRTLGRLRGVVWRREVGRGEGAEEGGEEEGEREGEGEGERAQPCVECLALLRAEWEEEARKIWEMMDQWIDV